MKLLKNNHGMTILEIIVTIMVLTIALTILTSGIFSANNFMSEGRKTQQSLDNQASALNGAEIDTVSFDKQKLTVSFTADGQQMQIGGTLVTAKDTTSSDASLQTFQLDGLEDYGPEWKMFKNMHEMPELHRTLTTAQKDDIIVELRKLGSNATNFYMNNDLFIYYIYHYLYSENLPKVDDSNIPSAYTGSKPLYMHPFLNDPLATGENVFVYATADPTPGVGKWNTSFVYDYGDGKNPSTATGWYYRKTGALSVNTYLKNYSCSNWSEFRRKVLLTESDGWTRVNP